MATVERFDEPGEIVLVQGNLIRQRNQGSVVVLTGFDSPNPDGNG